MAFPPIEGSQGVAQYAQNRQYQYFKNPTFIYPIIPATFVSMVMTQPNHELMWVDAVAEEISPLDFGKLIIDMKPDYIVFEANTMLINRYYEIIDGLKSQLPDIKVILCGEHLTALPEEVKGKCKADHFIEGGKWHEKAYEIVSKGRWPEGSPLPHINRDVTRWWLYGYRNGNFKRVPGTYTMASQDCWYRPRQACTFCSWVNYHPEYKVRDVGEFLLEIEELINKGFREFFDDSGTFPVGKWLHEFCTEMIERGYNKHIQWGCNMRFGVLNKEDFELMSKAGCRFILWGFESANQKTLDELSKGYKIECVQQDLILSRTNGIWNHLTVMMGYPWETIEEERRTFKMVKWLMLNDWAASCQSTIFMPYPGTESFRRCKEQGQILTEDWSKWDIANQVVKLKYDFKEALKLQRDYYNISYHWKFIFNKLKMVKSLDDLKYYFRLGRKVVDRFGNIHDGGKVGID